MADTKKEKKNLKKLTSELKRSKSVAGELLTAVERKDLAEVVTILETSPDLANHFSVINEEGKTALHVAIKNDDFPIVERLLQAAEHLQVDLNCKDSQGWTPLVETKIRLELLLIPSFFDDPISIMQHICPLRKIKGC